MKCYKQFIKCHKRQDKQFNALSNTLQKQFNSHAEQIAALVREPRGCDGPDQSNATPAEAIYNNCIQIYNNL